MQTEASSSAAEIYFNVRFYFMSHHHTDGFDRITTDTSGRLLPPCIPRWAIALKTTNLSGKALRCSDYQRKGGGGGDTSQAQHEEGITLQAPVLASHPDTQG